MIMEAQFAFHVVQSMHLAPHAYPSCPGYNSPIPILTLTLTLTFTLAMTLTLPLLPNINGVI